MKKGMKNMKNIMTGTYFKGEEAKSFNFYTELSSADKLKFVNSVVSILVDDNSYNSVIRNLIFDFYLINIFTDIDISELNESSFFINDVEQFLEETDIVDVIKVNAKDGLIEELNKAVDLNIEYLTGIHPNPLNEALVSLVNTLEKKMNDIDLSNMMGMVQKFAGMTDEFTPENIVNAYIDSDVHKKNLEEIEESKKQKG